MKGAANIEFMIAGVTFLAVVIYLIYALNSDVSSFMNSISSSIRISRAYRAFFSLFMTKGYPESWSDASSAIALGVAKSPWSIDEAKLAEMTDFCNSNYVAFAEKAGSIYYVVRELDGSLLYYCPTTKKSPLVIGSAEMGGRVVKIEVGVG